MHLDYELSRYSLNLQEAIIICFYVIGEHIQTGNTFNEILYKHINFEACYQGIEYTQEDVYDLIVKISPMLHSLVGYAHMLVNFKPFNFMYVEATPIPSALHVTLEYNHERGQTFDFTPHGIHPSVVTTGYSRV